MEFQLDDIMSYTRNLQAQIAEGGFSIVYTGSIPADNMYGLPAQEVAVKVSKPGRVQMFNNEIEHLPTNPQTNVIHIIGFCRQPEADRCYIVLPFLQKGALEQAYTELTWEQVLKIAKGTANGIGYFHNLNKVINDVKPANILLREDLTPFLCDFGSVAHTGSEFGLHAHNTPWYTNPIAIERGTVQKDDDLYAYGIVLLQLLMKEPVFVGSVNIRERALDLSRRPKSHRHVLIDMVMGKSNRKHVVCGMLTDNGCSRKDAKKISRLALRLVVNPQMEAILGEGTVGHQGIGDVIDLLDSIRVRRGIRGWMSRVF